jgi:hypothetical protein
MGDESRFSAGDQAVFTQVKDGEAVILDSETAYYFGLNDTAAFLWQTLQSHTPAVSEAELVAALVGEFDVDAEVAERGVRDFLAHVIRYGLARRVESAVNK